MVLWNSLPVFLDNLAESFSAPSFNPSVACAEGVCAEHGRVRAALPHYSLDQVIIEYQILRDVLFEVLDIERPERREDRQRIMDLINSAVSEVTSSFIAETRPANESRLPLAHWFHNLGFSGLWAAALIALGALLFQQWKVGLALLFASGSLYFVGRDNPTRQNRLCGWAGALALFLVVITPIRTSLSPGQTLSFLLLGISTSTTGLRRRHAVSVAQICALFAAVAPLWSFIGALYAMSGLIPFSPTILQLGTTLALLLLVLAVLAAHPDRSFMAVVTSPAPGGFLARRLLPMALVVPVTIGWVRLWGERRGWLSSGTGVSVVVILSIVLFTAWIWWNAWKLNHVDYERNRLLREAQGAVWSRNQLNVDLEALRSDKELRDRFISSLSHDLRTPLTAAKLNAQMIPRQLGDPEAVRTRVTGILSNVDRIDKMIRNLLDANRLHWGGKLPLEREEIDLSRVVRESIEEMKLVHGDRFSFSTAEDLSGFWDPSGLRRIVENLCQNAIKYGAPDSRVTVSLQRVEDQAVLSVHNLGKPIPPSEHGTLFEPFRRSNVATREKGWGIGLSLVKGVAEAHGGKVSLKSTQELGTTFVVTLPLKRSFSELSAQGASAQQI